MERNFFIDTLNYENIGAKNTQTLLQKKFTLEAGQKFANGRISFDVSLNALIPNIQFDYEIYFENTNHEKKIKKVRITGGSDDFVVRNIDDPK